VWHNFAMAQETKIGMTITEKYLVEGREEGVEAKSS